MVDEARQALYEPRNPIELWYQVKETWALFRKKQKAGSPWSLRLVCGEFMASLGLEKITKAEKAGSAEDKGDLATKIAFVRVEHVRQDELPHDINRVL